MVEYDESVAHCDDHYGYSEGCRHCDLAVLVSDEDDALIKSLTNHLKITPGDPGPKLQLVQQQLKRKVYVFLTNARADVVTAIRRKHKEMTKFTKDEKKELVLAATSAIAWADLYEAVYKDFVEGFYEGAVLGAGQLAVTIPDLEDMATAYGQKRAAEMVGLKVVDGNLEVFPSAKMSIARTTNDNLKELLAADAPIEQIIDDINQHVTFASKRASLISQNEIARSLAKGQLTVWKKSKKVSKVGIVLSDDHKDYDLCDIIKNGGPYAIEEAPTLPFHPLCGCSMVASELIQ